MARRRPPATPQAPEPPAGVRKRSQPGMFVEYEWRGIKCIRKWPRKRTQTENQKHFDACQLFMDRTKVMKEELAETQLAAREMSHKSGLLPRDVQMMLMANTFYGVFEIDGQLYWPGYAVTEVSQALDILNRTPGAILYRDESGWVGLLPAQPGALLTLTGSPPLPQWVAAPPPTTYDLVARLTPTAVSTTAQATKGQVYCPPIDIEARGIWAFINTTQARTYSMRLYELEGEEITAVLAEGPPTPLFAGHRGLLRHLLSPAITLKAGRDYWIAAGLTSNTDTTACSIAYNDNGADLTPVSQPQYNWARIPKRFPQVGDLVERASQTAVPYSAGFDG